MAMDSPLIILVIMLLTLPASHAALSPQVYWSTVLPNTPMPSAIRELLYPDLLEEKSDTSVTVGKNGVSVGPGGISIGPGGISVGPGGISVGPEGKNGSTSIVVGPDGISVGPAGKNGSTRVGTRSAGVQGGNSGNHSNASVGIGKDGIGVTSTSPNAPPMIVHVGPTKNPFQYLYRATEDQIRDDPSAALFFQENDLHPGSKMTVLFSRTVSGAKFLPRQVSDSIPFSSATLPLILAKYSVKPNSVAGQTIATTLRECEEPAMEGETKSCATSLEAMVDYMTSNLGTRNVSAISTTVSKEGTKKQVYTVTSGVRQLGGLESKAGACHAQPYVYAVFACHVTKGTKVYIIPMTGSDGTRAEAVAVCHTDTTKWNPNHLAFKVLNVKPGTVPVCHFLPQDHVVWISKN